MMRRSGSEVVLLAPLCRDEIVDPTGIRQAPGGAGFYAAWALAKQGVRVRLHTPLADGDADLLDALPSEIAVTVHPSRATTSFRIEIDPDQPNERRMTLLAGADPLEPDRIGPLDKAIHLLLGPLLPDDLSRGLLDRLGRSKVPIDLGIQGLVRTISPEGRVMPGIAGAVRLLPPLRVLAGDEEEMIGIPDVWTRAASELITTSGDRGARIDLRESGEAIDVAAVAPRGPIRHAIGLGDTFLAVYGLERSRGSDPARAGEQAAAAATELLECGIG